jgi:hypothetical protein
MKPDLGMTARQFAVVVIAAELARIRNENPLVSALDLLFGSDTDTAAAILAALQRQGLYIATAGDDVDG